MNTSETPWNSDPWILRGRIDALESMLTIAKADLTAALSRAERLKQYVCHFQHCDKAKPMPTSAGATYYWPVDYINWQVQQKCTCGLNAALSEDTPPRA